MILCIKRCYYLSISALDYIVTLQDVLLCNLFLSVSPFLAFLTNYKQINKTEDTTRQATAFN